MTPRLALDDARCLAELVYRRAGLVLTDEKTYLFESRLAPVARRFGFSGTGELARHVRRQPSESLIEAITEAMTTNETSFFRDGHPFDQLKKVILPRLLASRAGTRKLRIWSAAAATGQEPYSILFCLEDLRPLLDGWTTEIVATDLSSEALGKASEGCYSQFEVQRGLPAQYLARFFEQDGIKWRVRAEYRMRIKFLRHNLLYDGSHLGKFDIIFLRNVLIYFDIEMKRQILQKISSMLTPGGALFLGGTETALGVSDRFAADPAARGVFCAAS